MAELKISAENKDEIILWKHLAEYPAWQRVIAELQQKIKDADSVINLIGGDGDKRFSQRDIAIIKKNSYLDLIEMPEKMISMLSGTGTEPMEVLDPFEDLPEPSEDL